MRNEIKYGKIKYWILLVLEGGSSDTAHKINTLRLNICHLLLKATGITELISLFWDSGK